jgi:membrane protein DedA with SNARE-associated domain
VVDWLVSVIDALGYWGIALLMFLENVFPPIPSEVIMPLGGFAAYRGSQSLWGVMLAGTAGSVAGTGLWYVLGRVLDVERVERWFDRRGRWTGLSGDDLRKSNRWFARYGTWAVLLGRVIPTVRTLISLPAGFARMGVWRFLAFTLIGTLAWNSLLVAAGWYLRHNYTVIGPYIDFVAYTVVGVVVLWLGWRIIRYRSQPSEPTTGQTPSQHTPG